MCNENAPNSVRFAGRGVSDGIGVWGRAVRVSEYDKTGSHFNMNRPYVWRRDFTAAKFIEDCIVKAARGRPGFIPGFIFAGRTDEVIRKTRIREAIVELGIADNIIGTVAGKPETFRQCFERHYREPLRIAA